MLELVIKCILFIVISFNCINRKLLTGNSLVPILNKQDVLELWRTRHTRIKCLSFKVVIKTALGVAKQTIQLKKITKWSSVTSLQLNNLKAYSHTQKFVHNI